MGFILRSLYLGAKVYWKLVHPKTSGSRVMLIREDRVLLVKHSYQDLWFFPGGGVKWGETYEETAYREVREETGGEASDLRFLGIYNDYCDDKNDSIALFMGTDFTFAPRGDREIEEVRLFEVNELPPNLSPGCRRRLEEYLAGTVPSHGLW
ncbi:MAG: NUDIX domain-containing protein [Spirochaetales bacterium]|nr:NUDIX domain-containing protein [Spirochaetales bacterium]